MTRCQAGPYPILLLASSVLFPVSGLGAQAGRTLFVGDDPKDDIEGARAAGMRTAWVQPGVEAPLLRWMSEDEPEAAEGADITVARVTELASLL